MGIFLVAGFFGAALAVAIIFAVKTMQQYAPSAINNIVAYRNDMPHSGVKVYQQAQERIAPQNMPNRKFADLKHRKNLTAPAGKTAKAALVLAKSDTTCPTHPKWINLTNAAPLRYAA